MHTVIPSRPADRRVRRGSLIAAVAVAVGLAGCVPNASDGGRIVTDDERIQEVRAAREALADPVPTLVAEAERLVAALEDLWTMPAGAQERADRAGALRLDPLAEAVAALDEVELEGAGPDVEAARSEVDAIVAHGEAVLDAARTEQAALVEVAPFDARLEEVLAGWDDRGSYSQQLASFEEAAEVAEQLAEEAAGGTTTPACTGLWERRAEAAGVVAERTRELRVLVQNRRGQEFDDLRDQYRQDPFGLGGLLGELDAAAAKGCWADESEAPAALMRLEEDLTALEDALDPDDLQG